MVFRKLASHSKPSMEILIDEDAVKIIDSFILLFFKS